MIRFVILLTWLLTALLSAKSDIDQQITKTSSQIESFDKKYSTLSVRMARNAKEILHEKRTILKQQRQLQKLMLELGAKEKDYDSHKADLEKAKKSRNIIGDEQEQIEHDLIFAIASSASLSMMLDDERVISADALMTEEVLKNLSQQTQQEIASLNDQFSSNNARITKLQGHIESLKNAIAEIEYRQKELIRTQQSNKKALKRLEKNKAKYKASVERLLSQQNALQKTLSSLHIIKEDEAEKAARAKARREKAARKRASREKAERERARQNKSRPAKKATASKDLPSIKKIGSSYQNIKTKRYRGTKTIAPLDTYRLVKKFGPYTDPIYNLKIFNESVSLQPKQQNAKVKNVLNGKVILAQNTALLNNVVIIEHSNGIHTIYAHLDKIAPTIRKGRKVKKGSVIGRVSDELMFEVTQKNYHINPMQLIY